MKPSKYFSFALAGVVLAGAATLVVGDAREYYMQWEVHQKDRPQPPVVDPGYPGTQERTGKAPSDAIVLFDGTSTDAFVKTNGKDPIGWEIDDQGALVITRGTGSIQTKQPFGDMQLHVEFFVPESEAKNSGQSRGNSGIFPMKRYEIQVLDSKDNPVYPDGMVGALYGQFPPLVNSARGIGQWQTYDIIFRRPHFNEDGSLKKPARMTALINGILVQDNQEILGPCVHKKRTSYKAHEDALPIMFQNHGQTVHYRNMWVRELPPRIE